MYQEFFGLNDFPFKNVPDERIFFTGAQRQEMLDALLYGAKRGEGVIVVMGESGTGKTCLVQAFSDRASQDFVVINIITPNVSALEMLRLIAQESGFNPSIQAGKLELLELIRVYLLQLHYQHKRLLLLIDEAQTILVETFEELRLLSNMQNDHTNLIQLLLFGQPELDKMLNLPEMSHFKDRIAFKINMQPFSRDDLANYLTFRMQRVGYQGTDLFTDDAIDALDRKSQGYARAVNRLADHALTIAFAQGSTQILYSHIVPFNEQSDDSDSLENSENEKSNYNASQLISNEPENFKQDPCCKFYQWSSMIALIISLLVVYALVQKIISLSHTAELNTTAEISPIEKSLSELELPQAPSQVQAQIKEETSVETLLQTESGLEVNSTNQQPSLVVKEQETSSILPSKEFEPIVTWRRSAKTTDEWLDIHHQQLIYFQNLASDGKYTIQLMSSPWRLRDSFVNESENILDKQGKAPAYYYDYSAAPDRPRIAVIYGVYDSKESAKQAIDTLIEIKTKYKPDVASFKLIVLRMSESTVLSE